MRRAMLATAALVCSALLTGCGNGSPADTPAGGAPATARALTSPPPQPPEGLADPNVAAYQSDGGFTPDATRVLTAQSFALSLEHYRYDHGSCPNSLGELFPAYAPTGPGGTPMSGPPPASDGYSYSVAGSKCTVSVVLASGQAYSASAGADR